MAKQGRPIEYNQTYVTKAKEYLASCYELMKGDDAENDYQEPQGHGGSLKRFYKPNVSVRLPSKGGMARYLGVARDTLYDWASKYKDFSDVMEELGSIQEEMLINNGLSGGYNSTITKVLLTKHGYREGQDITSNDKTIKGNTVVFADFDETNS